MNNSPYKEELGKIAFASRILAPVSAALLVAWSLLASLRHLLFGGYYVVELLLVIVFLSSLWPFVQSSWKYCSPSLRYTLIGGILIVFACSFVARMDELNDHDNQSYFYTALADAFQKGQLHLIPMPSAELLARPDPYEPIDPRWRISDAVLYGGRYYLYYGPVPAIVLLMTRFMFPRASLDSSSLITIFVSTFFVLVFFIVRLLWQTEFKQLSWKLALSCFIATGFSLPVMWLVGRPSVYEAAISGGQTFLMAGIYLLILGLLGKCKKKELLLMGSGTAFGLAVGARWNLAIVVIFISILIALIILIDKPSNIKALLAFLCPLGLLALVYGAYNYARFGSPFELGLRYVLTGFYNNHKIAAFSLGSLKNNLILYSIAPIASFSLQYPFIHFFGGEPSATFYHLYGISPHPQLGYQIIVVFSSILWVAPLCLFACFPIAGLGRKYGRFSKGFHVLAAAKRASLDISFQYVMILALAAIGGFIPLLTFTGVVMRYHMDYYPALMLLASVGIFQVFTWLSKHDHLRAMMRFMLAGIVLYTTFLGLIASITGEQDLFQHTYPRVITGVDVLVRLLTFR